MRVIVDTNVVISGLISSDGPPAEIMDLWIQGSIEVAVSSPIISEYLGVLLRPKFSIIGPTPTRQRIIEQLIDLPNTVVAVPGTSVACVIEDPDDSRFLECAKASQADFIVSGDEHLLKLRDFDGIPIVSPRQFIEVVQKTSP